MRDVTEVLERADGARHGVDGFKGHDLGRARPRLGQELLQVRGVVVAEDVLGHAAVPDALVQNGIMEWNSGCGSSDCSTDRVTWVESHLDHGGVVALVGEDLAAGHVPGQREPIGVTIQSSGFGENTEEVLL